MFAVFAHATGKLRMNIRQDSHNMFGFCIMIVCAFYLQLKDRSWFVETALDNWLHRQVWCVGSGGINLFERIYKSPTRCYPQCGPLLSVLFNRSCICDARRFCEVMIIYEQHCPISPNRFIKWWSDKRTINLFGPDPTVHVCWPKRKLFLILESVT